MDLEDDFIVRAPEWTVRPALLQNGSDPAGFARSLGSGAGRTTDRSCKVSDSADTTRDGSSCEKHDV
jgi:hypothetical protein